MLRKELINIPPKKTGILKTVQKHRCGTIKSTSLK